jgi:hypothetical protein
MADSNSTTPPPGSPPTLAADYVSFMREAVTALRVDVNHSGRLHASALLDLLGKRLDSRADPSVMVAVGLVLGVVGATMVAEALKA